MTFRQWIGSAWTVFRTDLWGWTVGPIFLLSVAIENLYNLAPGGAPMVAVRIYAPSVALISILYCGLWFAHNRSAIPVMLGSLCALGLLASIYAMRALELYTVDVKLTIIVFKAITSFAVIFIFYSLDSSRFFARMKWFCIAAFEVYSFIQYPICKIYLDANLTPDQYKLWAIDLAASSCARAEGFLAAYAEVFIIAALLVMIDIWEWRRVRAGQSPSGRS